MTLEAAISSGSLRALVGTAAALGCLHTVLGPDHYVPFVMLARAEKWSRTRTAAVTFLCGLGPCESLIPLMLASWAAAGWAGIVLTTAAFSVTTVATIMAVTGLLLAGVSRIPLGPMDRYAHAAAGGSLVLCGTAILFLGL